jgi:hypothetical protein
MQAANYKMQQCLFVLNACVTASEMLLLNERTSSPEERTRRSRITTASLQDGSAMNGANVVTVPDVQ